jgi:hypothetical protein
MNQESVGMGECKELTELLDRPFRRRMCGHVHVKNPPGADLHRYEDVQHPERGGHRYEEVAGDDGLGVIPHEGGPTLAGVAPRLVRVQVPSHRPGRDLNAKGQLIRNSLFSPRGVVAVHLTDQFPEVLR